MAPGAAAAPQHDMSVAIVGAGFSGTCMAIQLKRAGFNNFTIFEAANDIGGTWRDNSYPGCACDIPSVLYCYSFEPYPWSEHYSGWREILAYQHHCVDKYGLWPHIKLGCRVTAASFDEGSGMWTVTAGNGEQVVVRVLVMAQGPLSTPRTPPIPGLSSFKGAIFHSSQWNHSLDLTYKRVAVVGTGASAIQFIPRIQPLVKQLHLFQRTPPWVLPSFGGRPAWARVAAQCEWWRAWLLRLHSFWNNELFLGLAMIGNKRDTLEKMEQLALMNLHQTVKDPQLVRALTPSYSIGCKRILASDVYYPALCQPNVQLVASAVKEIRDGTTIVAEDGSAAEVDVIILATGFDLNATLHDTHITGPGGQDLQTALLDKAQTLFGMAVPGFPNLFMIIGRNTALGHNSMVFMIECGVNAIVKMLRWMAAKRFKRVEVREAAAAGFSDEVQRRLEGSVWLSGGCSSWYKNWVGGRSSVLWPGLCVEYWWRTAWPKAGDWIVAAAGAAAGAKGPTAAAPAGAGAAGAGAVVSAAGGGGGHKAKEQ